MSRSQELYQKAKRIIPGGVQLLSKRPEQFAPGQWPNYAVKAKGCEVWDLDGRHFYDMTTNGIGACLLGYADPDVTKAVVDRIENGSMSIIESAKKCLAEKLVELHSWAECVRFARTVAKFVPLYSYRPRYDRRDVVAICGYHGWMIGISANLGEVDALDGQLTGFRPPAFRADCEHRPHFSLQRH